MRECQRLENIHLRYNYKHNTDITRKKKNLKILMKQIIVIKNIFEKREKYWWNITRNIVQPSWMKSHHDIFKLHLQPGVVLE